MTEATEIKTISKESAAEIAAHLSAVLKNPDYPGELYNAIGKEICDLSNDLTTREYCDSAAYIKMVLLAHINGEVPEQWEETKPLSSYTLPELLSAAFNHPDMDSDLRVDLWQRINDTDLADIDSPEYIGAMLGMKAEKISSCKPSFPRETLTLGGSPVFFEAKKHLNVLLLDGDYDERTIAALISLFGIISKQDDLGKIDLISTLQDYVFAHSRAFERAADEYVAKLGFRELDSDENDEETAENEPNENKIVV